MEQIIMAIRAKFKCEYCDKEMFDSVDNYKLWQVDHIIPLSSNLSDFDYQSLDNKAIACRQCNVSFKSTYNPINDIGFGKLRNEYILSVRAKIKEMRNQKQKDLDEMKKIFSCF